jgi:hypothetical protein
MKLSVRKPRTARRAKPVTFATVRQLALAMPGVEEGTSYGTPAFRVSGKFLGRLREDNETLVLKVGFETRDFLMEANPKTFFTTDHYRGYPSVLVRLATVRPDELGDVIEDAWRFCASKRLVEAYDKGRRSE